MTLAFGFDKPKTTNDKNPIQLNGHDIKSRYVQKRGCCACCGEWRYATAGAVCLTSLYIHAGFSLANFSELIRKRYSCEKYSQIRLSQSSRNSLVTHTNYKSVKFCITSLSVAKTCEFRCRFAIIRAIGKTGIAPLLESEAKEFFP